MADGPYRIGLNETQVGLVAPDGIQRLMRRVVGAHRAERLLVSGELVESEQALAIGLVDELTDIDGVPARALAWLRSEEHTSELQSLMRISYAVFCLKKKKNKQNYYTRVII